MRTAFAIAACGSVVGTVGLPHHVAVPIETVVFKNGGLRGGLPGKGTFPGSTFSSAATT
ncbi:hypothetical protein [Amycolatopsis jejuensis]|uniref:hypothetical protein n=1 Tax=Amycolatopsis jejuensis TaxID=330084 RepID=UPI000A4B37A2|nr:hypothetical protein [Amycolatopsis jejuensis]